MNEQNDFDKNLPKENTLSSGAASDKSSEANNDAIREAGQPTRRKRVRIGQTNEGRPRVVVSEKIPYNYNNKPRTAYTERTQYEHEKMPNQLFADNNMPNQQGSYDQGRPIAGQYQQRPQQGYGDNRYNNRQGYQQNNRFQRNNGYQQDGYQPRNRYQQDGYQPRNNRYQQGGYQRNNYRQNNYQQDNYNQGGFDRGQNRRVVYPHKPMQPGERRDGGYRNQMRPYPQQGSERFDNRRRNKPQKQHRKIIPVKYEEMVTDPNEEIRLNKILANAGICSRREADQLIQQGLVTVNGQVVTELGTRATRQDEILFQGRPVHSESKVYVLLNKPRNCVTTSDDPQCRLTVMDLVKRACQERIYPVGRLDRNTTGVILITNDGDLAAKLTHPQYKKKKIYHVWLDRDVKIEDMQKIAEGIELEDGEIHADAISYVKDDDPSQVGIEIHSGRNRIVRRIFEYLGYRVVKLDRVYFAGLTKKNLPRGKWRYLNEQEVNNLRMGCFE